MPNKSCRNFAECCRKFAKAKYSFSLAKDNKPNQGPAHPTGGAFAPSVAAEPAVRTEALGERRVRAHGHRPDRTSAAGLLNYELMPISPLLSGRLKKYVLFFPHFLFLFRGSFVRSMFLGQDV